MSKSSYIVRLGNHFSIRGSLYMDFYLHSVVKPNPAPKSWQKPILDTNAMAQTLKETGCRLCGGQVLLEGTLVLLLLRRSLESTVTKLGRGVDPLEVDLLQSLARCMHPHGLTQSYDTLLGTGDGALDHDPVVVHLTIANEATQAVSVLASDETI